MPVVGSNIVFEVQEPATEGGDYNVLFSYNGEYLDFCKNGKKEEKFLCEFEEFKKVVTEFYTTETFLEDCYGSESGDGDDKNSDSKEEKNEDDDPLDSVNLKMYFYLFLGTAVACFLMTLLVIWLFL